MFNLLGGSGGGEWYLLGLGVMVWSGEGELSCWCEDVKVVRDSTQNVLCSSRTFSCSQNFSCSSQNFSCSSKIFLVFRCVHASL